MAYTNALAAYKETRIRTASPGQLVVMLYDEAVKQLETSLEFLNQSKSGKLDPSKIEVFGKAMIKSRDIITELMVSLNLDEGGEIAQNLFALYTWFNRELMEAHMSLDRERIKTVKDQIDVLRGAWIEIASTTNAEERHIEGVNIAG